MKLFFLFIAIFLSINVSSQKKHCNTNPEPEEDLMMITTKCAVNFKKDKKGTKKRKLFIRVVGKRHKVVKKNKKIVASNGIKTKGVSSVSLKNEVNRLGKTELVRTLSRKISAGEIAKSIPLSAVKNIPLFPKCLNRKRGGEEMDCFGEELSKHVQKHLRYPKDAAKDKIEGDVWVRFIINSKGEVTNIEARGPKGGESLELEAKTVIANLPKFKPGVYNGRTVNIKYAFPINFNLE